MTWCKVNVSHFGNGAKGSPAASWRETELADDPQRRRIVLGISAIGTFRTSHLHRRMSAIEGQSGLTNRRRRDLEIIRLGEAAP